MNLETRARVAAEGLRSATTVNTEAGLARLRQTRRRRGVARVAAFAVAGIGLVGSIALAVDAPEPEAPPADHGPVESPIPDPKNGTVIDRPSDGAGEAQTSPFPIWQAFDQDAGLFLYTADGTTSKQRAVRTVRIVAPGQDPPVATIHCKEQCNLVDRSFGPGPDEVTVFEPEYPLVKRVRPSACCTVHVYGFDGVLRDRFDLAGVMNGAGIADLEWSPDGSRLAISTFSGGPMEPGCPEGDCETSEASLWIMERAGGDPVLMYKQSVPFEPSEWNNPMLMNLAWSPDGERVGFVATSWLPERADPPTLVGFDVESGQAQTLYEFDDCGTCNPTRWGFAWSPDGTRIAVTNGDRIAQLSSDGTTTYAPLGNGAGPLAWLARPRE